VFFNSAHLVWTPTITNECRAGPLNFLCSITKGAAEKIARKLAENWRIEKHAIPRATRGLGNVYSLTRFCPSTDLDEHFVYERKFCIFWGVGVCKGLVYRNTKRMRINCFETVFHFKKSCLFLISTVISPL
jgi:hypothetical protein